MISTLKIVGLLNKICHKNLTRFFRFKRFAISAFMKFPIITLNENFVALENLTFGYLWFLPVDNNILIIHGSFGCNWFHSGQWLNVIIIFDNITILLIFFGIFRITLVIFYIKRVMFVDDFRLSIWKGRENRIHTKDKSHENYRNNHQVDTARLRFFSLLLGFSFI
jgi:hypothetical protein